jgi:hypothetical protein
LPSIFAENVLITPDCPDVLTSFAVTVIAKDSATAPKKSLLINRISISLRVNIEKTALLIIR